MDPFNMNTNLLLINSSTRKSNKIFQDFYPIHPPVGIGFLISYAEKEGVKIKHIDEQVEDNMVGKIAKMVKGMEAPYIFGFSVLTSALKNSIELSQELRKIYPDSFIILDNRRDWVGRLTEKGNITFGIFRKLNIGEMIFFVYSSIFKTPEIKI